MRFTSTSKCVTYSCFLYLIYLVVLGADLLTVSNTRSSSVCCADSKLRTCSVAFVNPDVLGEAALTLPGGIEVAFASNIAGNANAYHYASNDAEVIITVSPGTGGMHGHAMMSSGASFTLEYCGSEGHVWKEIDVDSLGENEGVDYVATEENLVYDSQDMDSLLRQASADTKTTVTYSIKFYYTPEFKATTPDIFGFVMQVLAETNLGYANSGVPLVAIAHCIEAATINDDSSANTVLTNFRDMKSSTTELRGGADAAAILVNSFSSCGIAYLNTISSGSLVSATKKSCAVGYYSFGHEVGHNIGLTHDPDTSTNSKYAYGHGHLIAAGTASTGYRTILAYSASGHRTRVNYYSNPDVNYPVTGTPTGVAGLSNNAALLMQKRMALAAVGDETTVCAAWTTGAPTAAPPAGSSGAPTAAPTTGANCPTMSKMYPIMKVLKQITKVKTAKICKTKCMDFAGCEYWAWMTHRQVKKRKCRLFAGEFKTQNAWTSAAINC